jgi:hypothetical protein
MMEFTWGALTFCRARGRGRGGHLPFVEHVGVAVGDVACFVSHDGFDEEIVVVVVAFVSQADQPMLGGGGNGG